jgi:hypothetical protein
MLFVSHSFDLDDIEEAYDVFGRAAERDARAQGRTQRLSRVSARRGERLKEPAQGRTAIGRYLSAVSRTTQASTGGTCKPDIK